MQTGKNTCFRQSHNPTHPPSPNRQTHYTSTMHLHTNHCWSDTEAVSHQEQSNFGHHFKINDPCPPPHMTFHLGTKEQRNISNLSSSTIRRNDSWKLKKLESRFLVQYKWCPLEVLNVFWTFIFDSIKSFRAYSTNPFSINNYYLCIFDAIW